MLLIESLERIQTRVQIGSSFEKSIAWKYLRGRSLAFGRDQPLQYSAVQYPRLGGRTGHDGAG